MIYHNNTIAAAAAIILSAGHSERFDRAKAFLAYDEDQSFLQHLVQVYASLPVSKIVLVLHPDLMEEAERQAAPLRGSTPIALVQNTYAAAGRFASIRLGVQALSSNEAAFIQNIDNPFTSTALLRAMLPGLDADRYVAPICKGQKAHPILLPPSILQQIRDTEDPDTDLYDILAGSPHLLLATDNTCLLANINTAADYLEYFHHAAPH